MKVRRTRIEKKRRKKRGNRTVKVGPNLVLDGRKSQDLPKTFSIMFPFFYVKIGSHKSLIHNIFNSLTGEDRITQNYFSFPFVEISPFFGYRSALATCMLLTVSISPHWPRCSH